MLALLTVLLETPRRYFRLIEALGLAMVLLSWSFNWWSTEEWSDASTTLRDNYDRLERSVMTAQTFNVIRYEASIGRATAQLNSPASASYGTLIASTWRSGDLRQKRLAVTSLNVHGLDLFLKQISPLLSKYAPQLDPQLVDAKASIENVRRTLHDLSPVDKDIPMSQAPVPNEQKYTLEVADQLELRASALVARTLSLNLEALDFLNAQKKTRILFANLVFAIGSLFVALAKYLEWSKERQLPQHRSTTPSQPSPLPPLPVARKRRK